MSLAALAAVATGGAAGATLRYLISGWVYARFGAGFPIGTLAVNLIGCFLIGLVMEMTETRFLLPPVAKLFVTVGLLGGLTTFSTYSFETLALLRDGSTGLALANAFGSLALGLVAVWVGVVAGRGI